MVHERENIKYRTLAKENDSDRRSNGAESVKTIMFKKKIDP